MSLGKAVAVFSSFTFISRILGFVRDILSASILGAGIVADCFFVALKLPNFFRRLFAEGAFSASFVPVFTATLTQGGREEALSFAETAFSSLIVVLLILVAVMEIFAPGVIYILAGGFSDDEAKFQLAVVLTRITFPFLLFISLVSLLGGVLNALGKFSATAATPIILNLCMISALIFFSDQFDTPAHSLALAVSVAGIIQLIWLYLACRRVGYKIRIVPPRMTPKVKEMLLIMMPAALGAGVIQINLMLDMIIASHLPDGSISFLFYADRLNQLPIGVIGVALGTVLLPLLARNIAEGDEEQVSYNQNRAIELGLFLTIPAAVAFMIVPHQLIHVLFERGAFTADDSWQTAYALMAYAAGLPAYVLAKVFSPGYFARKDTRTPVKFAMVALAVNMTLNLILMQYFAHVGLAMATAISAWLNVAMLSGGLVRRGHFSFDSKVLIRVAKYLLASGIMAVVIWLTSGQISDMMSGNMAVKVSGLLIVIFAGIGSYLLMIFITGAMKIQDLKAIFRRKKSG
ncbi:MAG: murein biosynthesis integral membrane protein MurJ [Alphaproteobacteria bacterium]|nr:MAG: murein biosynthesis integral membrane protein MurJ [Alphaproteobacteria bacterium]